MSYQSPQNSSIEERTNRESRILHLLKTQVNLLSNLLIKSIINKNLPTSWTTKKNSSRPVPIHFVQIPSSKKMVFFLGEEKWTDWFFMILYKCLMTPTRPSTSLVIVTNTGQLAQEHRPSHWLLEQFVIILPNWKWILERLVTQWTNTATRRLMTQGTIENCMQCNINANNLLTWWILSSQGWQSLLKSILNQS